MKIIYFFLLLFTSQAISDDKFIYNQVNEYYRVITDAEKVVKDARRKIQKLQTECPHPLQRQVLFQPLPGLSVSYDIRCQDCRLERPGWLPQKQFVKGSKFMRDTTPEEHAAIKAYVDSIRNQTR